MKRFKGKVVLVTGGSTGIGLGIARRFAEEGATVVITARQAARGSETQAALRADGLDVHFYRADVTLEDDVCALVTTLNGNHGRLDILVNNAGCGLVRSSVTEATPPGERWAFYRGVNLDAAYLLSAHCLPHLAKHDGATVINISSTSAHHGNWGLYGVAKAGIEGLTRAFAAEAAPHGVRVNGISPGWVDTVGDEDAASISGALPPSLLGRMGTPAEMAGTAAFLASDDAAYITGQTLVVDGGMSIIDYASLTLLDRIGHRGQSSSGDGPKS